MSKALARRAAVAVVDAPDRGNVATFERLAKDPNVDVEKLERLIQLQKELMKMQAQSAFHTAYAEMQLEIPEIDEKGRIAIEGRPTRSYATHEDIQTAIRPILHRHGFALSFRTEWPEGGRVKVIGILTHRDGHARTSSFEAPPDDSGKKNSIQMRASTVSYGRRYTTLDLLNITTRGADTDGEDPADGNWAKRAGELRGVERRGPIEPTTTYGDHAGDMRTISTVGRDGKGKGQLGRLIMIAKNANRSDDEIKAWLFARYGWRSKKSITREKYDEIIQFIQAPGPLPGAPAPVTRMREPGEDE